jgi:cell cycle arrest protein BUB2
MKSCPRQGPFFSSSPIKVLRELELDAKPIIQKTMEFVKVVSEDLYDLLVRHPYDPSVYDALFSTW